MTKKINHFQTENGLKIIHAFDNTSKIISIHLIVKSGSGYETETEAGYSHFLEHLVFKSTKSYKANSLMDYITNLGGNINAYTEYESTCYYINISSKYLKEAIEVLSELFFFADFNKDEFLIEKKVVLEELKQYKNDPDDYFLESIPNLIATDSPYSKPIIGNIKSLQNATIEKLKAFYKKYYFTKNAFLCICGDFDVKYLKKYCNKYFNNTESLKNRNITPKFKNNKINYYNLSNSKLNHFKSTSNSSILAFVLPEYSDNNKLSNASHILSKCFCTGKNSRLYQRLYNDEKLIDNIKTQSIAGQCDGFNIILIYPRNEVDVKRIIDIFLQEINKIINFGAFTEEIELAKNELLNSSNYVYEYMEVLAQTISVEEITKDYTKFFDYENDIKTISNDDINKVIKELYRIEKLHLYHSGKKSINYQFAPFLDKMVKQEVVFNKNSAKKDIISCVLPNGLKLLLKNTGQKSICGVSLALGVSQLDENKDELGINQFTLASMLYGDEKRDYQSRLKYCSANGVQLSVSCGKETSRFKIKCFKNNLFDSLQMLIDILKSPTFPKNHISNIKNSFISNIKRVKDYQQSEAVFQWKKMIFGANSNILSKYGTEKTLRKLCRNDIIKWYKNVVLNVPATLCIVGDFDIENTYNFITDRFATFTFNDNFNDRSVYVEPSIKDKRIINQNYDQSVINIGGFCMPSVDIQYRAPMNVLSQIIGGEISSRMFNILRENNGLAYSVDFDYELLNNIGYYLIYAVVDKKKEKEAMSLINKMQTDLRKTGANSKEINIAKNYILGQMQLGEESMLSQAQIISSIITLGQDYNYYQEREKRIKQVKKEDIQYILDEYFNPIDQYKLILH
jgi:zinc protease